jgi:RNA polymerase sigma-70 factor (ECF subfamily)
MLDRSSEAVQQALATPSQSPSNHAVRREQAVLLADALEKLPADYREVFILRNLEHIPFDQVAERMGRTPGAARVLWKRAMDRLSLLLRDQS